MDGKKIILGAILIFALVVPNLEAGKSECWLDGHSCRTANPADEDFIYGCCPGFTCIPNARRGNFFEGECWSTDLSVPCSKEGEICIEDDSCCGRLKCSNNNEGIDLGKCIKRE
ncbi:uncharacterized protein LOC141609389 [Silene latifolia]|uniref:uncharacterized protein LOC141609389 n=1 Tax=Silene latifolia TaxID=37657 RepID=UPI003D771894